MAQHRQPLAAQRLTLRRTAALVIAPAHTAVQPSSMHKVSGIGGFFFRAKDPDAIAAWYRDNLGVDPVPMVEGAESWRQEAGETAFTAMDGVVDQFGDPSRAWAINFRVPDLDGMVEQLRAAAIDVDVDSTTYSMGRFASLRDPEGNPIQLWEPSEESA